MKIKKILKFLGIGYLVYCSYCFIRGYIHGAAHPNATPEERLEAARKIASFRG